MNFETNSLVILGLALLLVCILPVKLLSPLFGAQNNSFVAAGLSLIVGIVLAVLGSMFTDYGLIASYIGLVASFFVILKTSLLGSLIMPAAVLLIGIGIAQLLSNIGLLGFGGA